MNQSPSDKPVAILSLFFVFAFVLRLVPHIEAALHGHQAYFTITDAYYHLRRTLIFAHNFPRLITLDYYMNYPFGAESPWPPLFDYAAALISLVLAGGKADKAAVEAVLSFLPPLIASLSVFPVYSISMQIFHDRRIALISSFLYIIMPGSLWLSNSGDHHPAETYFALYFFHYGLKSIEDIFRNSSYVANSLVSGLFIALGTAVWQGETFFFTLWIGFVGLLLVHNWKNKAVLNKVAFSTWLCGTVCAALTGLLRLLFPISIEKALFNFGYFSFFQPIYVFSLSLLILILCLFLNRTSSLRRLTVCLVVFIASVILAVLLSPLKNEISGAMHFVMSTDPWYSTIDEFRPAFKSLQIQNPRAFLFTALHLFSLTVPIGYAFYFCRFLVIERDQENERAFYYHRLFYCLSAIILGLMGFYQVRWNNAYSPFLAMGNALFIHTIYKKTSAWFGSMRFFRESHHANKAERCQAAAFGAAAVITTVIFLPNYYITRGLLQFDPFSEDTGRTFSWIRENTPPTNFLLTPDRKPEYSVLSFWSYGHQIQYIAERPSVTNNYGHQLGMGGFADSLRVWTAPTEEKLLGLCGKYEARFLLLAEPADYIFSPLSAYLDTDMAPLIDRNRFLSLPLFRLYETDGAAGPLGPAIGHFRLIYESRDRSSAPYHLREIKYQKVFERVAGATITGKTAPGAAVRIHAPFLASHGDRAFSWEARTSADEKGVFRAVLPYATAEMNYSVKPLGNYTVSSGTVSLSLPVTNADVLKGNELFVDLARRTFVRR